MHQMNERKENLIRLCLIYIKEERRQAFKTYQKEKKFVSIFLAASLL
jgi:hypothetical protein